MIWSCLELEEGKITNSGVVFDLNEAMVLHNKDENMMHKGIFKNILN